MSIEPFIVDNYIVRIYRRSEEDIGKLTGVVEQVSTEENVMEGLSCEVLA